MRDKMFAQLPDEWHQAYEAGMFTEFMEQRAPGHTVLDGKIYAKGMLDFKREIAEAVAGLDFLRDAEAFNKREALRSFDISCDALIRFAERHAALAREKAAAETDAGRRTNWKKLPKFARGSRPMRRGISTRRCNIIGFAIWR
jgi:formate C-acetyltransferase